MEDCEIGERLRRVIALLEEDQKQIQEVKLEVKDFVTSADVVLQQININEEEERSLKVSEIHWKTYSSHDWFAGFAVYPKTQLEKWRKCEKNLVSSVLLEITDVLQEISLLYQSFEAELNECERFFDGKAEAKEEDAAVDYESVVESVLENVEYPIWSSSEQGFEEDGDCEEYDKKSLSMSYQSFNSFSALETYFE